MNNPAIAGPPLGASTAGWANLPRLVGGPLYGNAEFGQFVRTATIGDLRLDVTTHAAGSSVPEHLHSSPLLILVLEGEIEERSGGRTTIGRPGTMRVHAEGMGHEARFPVRTRLFTAEPGPGWLDRVGARGLTREMARSDWSDRLTPLALKVYAGFTLLDQGPAGSMALQGYLQALLAELLAPAKSRGEPLWLRDARRYLDDHLAERFDLGALARRVGVHPVHLSRSFRRYFGVTITEYLRQGRLSYAMARLSISDDPVSAVATGAGFADQSHLTRLFRRAFGNTPAGYRAGVRERAARRPQ